MIDLLPHLPSLKRYALALTRSPDRADDLVQDTLTRAIAKQHLFEPGTDLGAWLRTMMHHGHASNVRQRMRRDQTIVRLPDAWPPPQDAHVFLCEIMRAMEALPAGQRQTLCLLSEGEAREEIAQRMGVPLNTVRSRARLARRALRAVS